MAGAAVEPAMTHIPGEMLRCYKASSIFKDEGGQGQPSSEPWGVNGPSS